MKTVSPMKGRLDSSGINESSEFGGPARNISILKDNNRTKNEDGINEGALRKLDRKTVRMAGFGANTDDAKSVKSRDVKSHKSVDPYEDKTVEEIEVEMEKHRRKIEDNNNKINHMKNDKLKSKMNINKETQPLREEIKMLRDLVIKLDKIREDKIPYYEKLPKDCVFYRHKISSMFTTKINVAAFETAKDEKNLLKEVGEVI